MSLNLVTVLGSHTNKKQVVVHLFFSPCMFSWYSCWESMDIISREERDESHTPFHKDFTHLVQYLCNSDYFSYLTFVKKKTKKLFWLYLSSSLKCLQSCPYALLSFWLSVLQRELLAEKKQFWTNYLWAFAVIWINWLSKFYGHKGI